MKNVLVKTAEIKKVVPTEDACLVIMQDGKTWVCEKRIEDGKYYLPIVEYIQNHQGDRFVKLPLKTKNGEQK